MLLTIREATAEPGFNLRLIYSDGETIVVDFKPLIEQNGVFAPLSDPDFFSQVSIGEHGRYIQWPRELDFCADALWLQGHAGNNRESNSSGFLQTLTGVANDQ